MAACSIAALRPLRPGHMCVVLGAMSMAINMGMGLNRLLVAVT